MSKQLIQVTWFAIFIFAKIFVSLILNTLQRNEYIFIFQNKNKYFIYISLEINILYVFQCQ